MPKEDMTPAERRRLGLHPKVREHLQRQEVERAIRSTDRLGNRVPGPVYVIDGYEYKFKFELFTTLERALSAAKIGQVVVIPILDLRARLGPGFGVGSLADWVVVKPKRFENISSAIASIKQGLSEDERRRKFVGASEETGDYLVILLSF